MVSPKTDKHQEYHSETRSESFFFQHRKIETGFKTILQYTCYWSFKKQRRIYESNIDFVCNSFSSCPWLIYQNRKKKKSTYLTHHREKPESLSFALALFLVIWLIDCKNKQTGIDPLFRHSDVSFSLSVCCISITESFQASILTKSLSYGQSILPFFPIALPDN